MKTRSRWIDEMPMIAIASLILSTLALTWLSHSGWSGMLLQLHPRHERLVAADDHHDQQVRDHHHVDQAEHDQHDLLLGEAHRMRDEVQQFLEEQHDVDALRHDQPEIERELQPARREDQLRQRPQLGPALRRDHGIVGSHGHGTRSPRRGASPARAVIFDSAAALERRGVCGVAEAESRWNSCCGDCRNGVLPFGQGAPR